MIPIFAARATLVESCRVQLFRSKKRKQQMGDDGTISPAVLRKVDIALPTQQGTFNCSGAEAATGSAFAVFSICHPAASRDPQNEGCAAGAKARHFRQIQRIAGLAAECRSTNAGRIASAAGHHYFNMGNKRQFSAICG